MLKKLDVEFELNEIDLKNKPEDFKEKSPTGKVPMVVEDDFILYESQVINDYFVERFDWETAYSTNLRFKYQQKVCMKQWDSSILGPVYESLSHSGLLDDKWGEISPELSFLQEVVKRSNPSTDTLFAFHFAPFWARFKWLSDYTTFPERLEDFPALKNWLNETIDDPLIEQTLPDAEWARQQYEENYVEEPS